MGIKVNIQNTWAELNKIMDSSVKHIYVSKLKEQRFILGYTKYQDGLWSVDILYALLVQKIWLGPHE